MGSMQSSWHSLPNGGRRVGLLCGASTRMASWFYAMMRILRHRNVLLASIHTTKFCDLIKNDRVRGAVFDIEDPLFFKALFVLLRAVFPSIRALRYSDSNTPMMDKIYFLSKRTVLVLTNSIDALNNPDLLGKFVDHDELGDEIAEVWGYG